MEKTLKSNYIYQGSILNLRVDEVEKASKIETREVIEHSGGVCILVIKDEKLVLVKQYRYCFKQELLELPAGKIDSGETPLGAASRELFEETGISTKNFTFLGKVYPSCGYTNEEIYLYMTTDVSKFDENYSNNEINELIVMDIDDVLRMINNGTLKDAKTICAVLKYYAFYVVKKMI